MEHSFFHSDTTMDYWCQLLENWHLAFDSTPSLLRLEIFKLELESKTTS